MADSHTKPSAPSGQLGTERCPLPQNPTQKEPMLTIFAEAEADLGGSGSRDVGEAARDEFWDLTLLSGGPLKNAPMGPQGPQINRPIGPWVISNALSIA